MKIIPLRQADLGEGFQVARALPTKDQRMVGPWCFLDRIGPVALTGGAGMHVAAHPHTCLQTFTWVMEGSILHRDSLGTEQVIHPGQVNLMTAGHGISHTEDTLPGTGNLHAAQLWIALPPEHADMPPDSTITPGLRNGIRAVRATCASHFWRAGSDQSRPPLTCCLPWSAWISPPRILTTIPWP